MYNIILEHFHLLLLTFSGEDKKYIIWQHKQVGLSFFDKAKLALLSCTTEKPAKLVSTSKEVTTFWNIFVLLTVFLFSEITYAVGNLIANHLTVKYEYGGAFSIKHCSQRFRGVLCSLNFAKKQDNDGNNNW